jgi:hypothetical protein
MEYRPHSRPEKTVDIGPELFTRTRTDNFVMEEAIIDWIGPKHVVQFQSCTVTVVQQLAAWHESVTGIFKFGRIFFISVTVQFFIITY